MMIVQPSDLKTLLEQNKTKTAFSSDDKTVLFLHEQNWEPHPAFANELEPLKASYLLLERNETAPHPEEKDKWTTHAQTGWLVYIDAEYVSSITDLLLKPDRPIGCVLKISTLSNPHTRSALLIGLKPIIHWSIARRESWVRPYRDKTYAELTSVRFGAVVKSKTLLFPTGDAIVLSPRGGVRPYWIQIYRESPKIW